MRYDVNYGSLTELIEAVRHKPYKTGEGDHWTGGSFQTAIDLALNGWPEGARKATELAQKIANRTIQNPMSPLAQAMEYDVYGAAYDPGALAHGTPEMWGVFQPVGQKKGVRIVANICVSAGISASVMMRRGIAICALVLALQSAGYICVVDVVAQTNVYDWTNVMVRVASDNGSPLDIDRVVYALAHPTMLRQLMFSAGVLKTPNMWYAPVADKPDVVGDHTMFLGGVHLFDVERWQDGGEAWVLAEYLRQTQG